MKKLFISWFHTLFLPQYVYVVSSRGEIKFSTYRKTEAEKYARKYFSATGELLTIQKSMLI